MKKIISVAVTFCMLFCMLSFSAVAEVSPQITIENVYATTKAITIEFNNGVKFDYDEASEKYENVIITDAENTVLDVENVTMSEDNKTAVIELETPFSITTEQQTNYTLLIPYLYSADGATICLGTKIDIAFDTYWQDDFESYIVGNVFNTDLFSQNYRFLIEDGAAYDNGTDWSNAIKVEKVEENSAVSIMGASRCLEVKKYGWNQYPNNITYEFDLWAAENQDAAIGLFVNLYPNKWYINTGTDGTALHFSYNNQNEVVVHNEVFSDMVSRSFPTTVDFRSVNASNVSIRKEFIETNKSKLIMYGNGRKIFSGEHTSVQWLNTAGYVSLSGFWVKQYIDNLKLYNVTVNKTNGQTYTLPKIENVVITGKFEENTDISCGYNEIVSFEGSYSVKDEYQWFKGDDYFAEFPGDSWTALTQTEGNKCTLSASDLDSYVVCRVIRSIDVPVGDDIIKLVLNDEKSQPIAKPAAPVCHNPEIKYEHTEPKDTLAFTYEYFDANMDEENGTVILWEESEDENIWTASSLTPTVTKDGSKTKSEINVTGITDKYFRCSVTVKNAEPTFGDGGETVTLSYVMPFRPVANGITVSGNSQVGSILTADYDYFDVNGDKEVGSEIMWIRKDNMGNETVVSQNSYSYLVQQDDSGCSIAFAVIPKNTFSKDGDKTYSTFLSVPVYTPPSTSSGGGGDSYYIGYKDISVHDKETNATEKPTTNVKFTDVESHWAYNEITTLAGKGYIKGKSENDFAPEDKITRAEWLTLLLRCANIDTDNEYSNCFNDVGKDDWYAKTVQKAYELGFISGNNGSFNANDIVTREQMAKMIISVYEYKTQKTAVASSLDGFSDKSDLSKWAEGYMEKAVGMEFIKGVTDNSLSPLSYATRAQSAVILVRFIDKL